MTFDDFVVATLEYLWRVGDTQLTAAMPAIVGRAESRLRTDLKLTDEDVEGVVSATSETVDLPANLDRLHTVTFPGYGAGEYTTNHSFYTTQGREPGGWPLVPSYSYAVSQLDYTVVGKTLAHRLSASVDDPIDIYLTYTPKPASLVDDDDTVFSVYPDLYSKCVYVEAMDFAREDDRMVAMEARYQQRLGEVLIDQERRRFAGSPLKMKMPGVVA